MNFKLGFFLGFGIIEPAILIKRFTSGGFEFGNSFHKNAGFLAQV
jgi:hypothetical protein